MSKMTVEEIKKCRGCAGLDFPVEVVINLCDTAIQLYSDLSDLRSANEELINKVISLEGLLLKVMAERDKLQDEVDIYELGYRGFP